MFGLRSVIGADLRGVDLIDADLRDADLSEALLSGADLSGANLSGALLFRAILRRGEYIPPLIAFGTRRGNLRDTDLSKADIAAIMSADDIARVVERSADRCASLSRADLRNADLSEADLRRADLSEAVLSGAVLRRTNLSGAKGVTNEKLEAQTKSLEGATMPKGQKYEDWLKDKDRGEDGNNSGTS